VVEINRAIIEVLEVYTGNEDLYFLALLSRVYEFATARKQINAQDLHAAKIEIDEWISAGDQNPAVNQGWIGKLLFEDDPRPTNYYEGKGARPSHILDGLDAYRGMWIQQIHNELQSRQVCVVRASSGQGKSTLLFRYAYDFYDRHTVLVIRDLQDDSRIEPVKRYIEALLKLNLPLLVLINDLADKTKNWHELVRQLTGKPVSFLIAARNENWFRYSANLEDIDWATVLPEMRFEEAQQIFDQFQHAGRIAPNIRSAAWAYEQVSEKKLLIEFVFLITQGQMLSERLEGQIKAIHQLQEDKAKLEILRLISLAQVLDMSLSWEIIAKNINTQSDMQQLLLSMRDEYLTISPDGNIEGLHYVRSDHLVRILHDGYPLTKTVQTLLNCVPEYEIAETVYSIYTNPTLSEAYIDALGLLVELTRQDISHTLVITEALFRADEYRYITANRNVIDVFIEEFNAGALSVIFIHATSPIRRVDPFELIRPLNMPASRIERMRDLVDQMPARGVRENRFAKTLLDNFLKQFSSMELPTELGVIAELDLWITHFGIEVQIIQSFVETGLWSDRLFLQPLEDCASFILLLYEKFNTVYESFWLNRQAQVIEHFLRSTNTLSLVMENSDIRIEFVVDEAISPHEQVMKRLDLLRNWIPHFETYSSQGLYPITPIARLSPDETIKSISKRHFVHQSVEINKHYFQEIRHFYSTRFMYDYLRFWHDCRHAFFVFIEVIIDRVERQIARKSLKSIQPEIDQILPYLQSPPELPVRYQSVFKDEHNSLKKWQAEMRDFVNAYLRSQNMRSSEETRLYRHNLYSVQSTINEIQIAIDRIRHAEGIFFDLNIDNRRESSAYRALYETIECWLEMPDNYALSKGVKSRDYAKIYIRKRKQRFQEQLQRALASLENYSAMIRLPDSYMEEPPLYNLAIGSDICSSPSKNLSDALEVAVMLLSNLEFNYTYTYVIPLLNNQPVFGFAYRVQKDTVLKLSRGEQLSNKIEIFHDLVTETMLDTIPSITRTAVPEADLYISALSLIGQLKGLRNEFALASLRLKNDMPDYLEDIYNRITARSIQIMDSRKELFEQTSNIITVPADEEWKQLWEHFMAETDKQKATIVEIEGYSPEAPADDAELSDLYNAYLIRRYCGNLAPTETEDR
jgi:hypothetical protein